MSFDLGSWGSVIGAGISGLAGIAGGAINASASKSAARAQVRLQREFAQNGIQWRVEDAKKAGIHPLYALGANTATYTPVSQDSSALGNAVADAGAYLGKAVDQAIDAPTRKALEQENLEYARLMREGNLALMREQIRGAVLMNDEQQMMLNSQRVLGSGNPARPVVVSTPMGEFGVNNPDRKRYTAKVSGNNASALAGVKLEPALVTMSSPGNPARGAGAHADYDLIRTEDGYRKVMSQAFADRTDDDIVAKLGWHMRHGIGDRINYIFSDVLPQLDKDVYPLPEGLPAGYTEWRYHPVYDGWYPYDAGSRRYWSKSRKTYFY